LHKMLCVRLAFPGPVSLRLPLQFLTSSETNY
jgi:hypothetical protein